MRCKDAILSDTLMENHSVNCLTFEQNAKKGAMENFVCLNFGIAFEWN